MEVVQFREGGFTTTVSGACVSGGIGGVAQDDIGGFAVVENAMVKECRFSDVVGVRKGREEGEVEEMFERAAVADLASRSLWLNLEGVGHCRW